MNNSVTTKIVKGKLEDTGQPYEIHYGYTVLDHSEPAVAVKYTNGFIDKGILIGNQRVYGEMRPDWDEIKPKDDNIFSRICKIFW